MAESWSKHGAGGIKSRGRGKSRGKVGSGWGGACGKVGAKNGATKRGKSIDLFIDLVYNGE